MVNEAGLIAVMTIQYNGMKANKPNTVKITKESANFDFCFTLQIVMPFPLIFDVGAKPFELQET